MKVNLRNDSLTQLSLIPETSADEAMIAGLLRVFVDGGEIHALSNKARKLIYRTPAADTISEEGMDFQEFIEFLR